MSKTVHFNFQEYILCGSVINISSKFRLTFLYVLNIIIFRNIISKIIIYLCGSVALYFSNILIYSNMKYFVS